MRAWIVGVCAVAACGDDRSPPVPEIPPACNADPVVSSVVGCKGIGFGLPSVDVGPGHVMAKLVDVNADGKLDLVSPRLAMQGGVGVSFGNGDGTFGKTAIYSAGGEPVAVAVGDLDGNGSLDLAVVSQANDFVYVLANDGTGTFGAATTIAVASGPRDVEIADIGADGINDLVVTSFYAQSISVIRGTGGGAFATPVTTALGFAGYRVAVGKLNADAYPDIAVVGYSGPLEVFVSAANGTFGSGNTYSLGGGSDIVITDVNADGEGDVVVASGGAAIFKGTGGGALGTPTTIPFGVAQGVTVADFDGDGRRDVAVVGWEGLAIMSQGTTGVFTATPYPFSTVPQGGVGIDAADLDGDGHPDLAVATNDSSTGIAILRNQGSGTFPSPELISHDLVDGAGAADLDGDGHAEALTAGTDLTVFGAATTTYPLQAPGYSIAAADVNGDGKIDVIVATEQDVEVFFGDGAGLLGNRAVYDTGCESFHVQVIDLDGDHAPEIVLPHPMPPFNKPTGNSIGVLHNNGDGTFAQQTIYRVGSPTDVAFGDFDSDGRLDMAVANYAPFEIDLLHGEADGTYVGWRAIPLAQPPVGIAASQIDPDCHTDLVVYSGGAITTLHGRGDGSFGRRSRSPTLFYGTQTPFTLMDFDGDGHEDVIVTTQLSIAVQRGFGDGTFATPAVYSTPGHPMVVGDLDGDTRSDLVIVDWGQGEQSAYPPRIFTQLASCAP